MSAHNLDIYREAFNGVGWFIPPYVSMGFSAQAAVQVGLHVDCHARLSGVISIRIQS
jgi:hypothetical protein